MGCTEGCTHTKAALAYYVCNIFYTAKHSNVTRLYSRVLCAQKSCPWGSSLRLCPLSIHNIAYYGNWHCPKHQYSHRETAVVDIWYVPEETHEQINSKFESAGDATLCLQIHAC